MKAMLEGTDIFHDGEQLPGTRLGRRCHRFGSQLLKADNLARLIVCAQCAGIGCEGCGEKVW